MDKINLQTSVNHHIALTAVMIKRVFIKILSKNKIAVTPEQWVVLYNLSESGGNTIGELSDLTFKDFANTSRITKKLENAGLVLKERDSIDKRVYKLLITEEGTEILDQLHQCASESTNVAMEGIDDDTKAIMVKNLKHILGNTENYLK